MSVSTDGIIFYGWLFEEGHEFPWDLPDDGDFDGDMEKWWRSVNGYKPLFELYTDDGYAGGKKPIQMKIDQYYSHQHEWEEANPLPFELVDYCSDECPIYALAVKGTVLTANRGYPKPFSPYNLSDTFTALQVAYLETFCKKYGIELKGEPQWWLASYWG